MSEKKIVIRYDVYTNKNRHVSTHGSPYRAALQANGLLKEGYQQVIINQRIVRI